jgi:hypothetical protein
VSMSSAPEPQNDRRLHPRRPTVGQEFFCLPFTLDVEVLELGLGGVLLAGAERLRLGQQVHLRLMLGNRAMTALVQVARLGSCPRSGRTTAAAVFVDLPPLERQLLQQFLPQV